MLALITHRFGPATVAETGTRFAAQPAIAQDWSCNSQRAIRTAYVHATGSVCMSGKSTRDFKNQDLP